MAIVLPFDQALHSGASADHCGQGGTECGAEPEFSVRSRRHTVSACARHLVGAVRQANGMSVRSRERSRT
jgi:hypothetical protein